MYTAFAGSGVAAYGVLEQAHRTHQWRPAHVQPGIGPLVHLVLHMLMAGLTWRTVEHFTRAGHWAAAVSAVALVVLVAAAFVLHRKRTL